MSAWLEMATAEPAYLDIGSSNVTYRTHTNGWEECESSVEGDDLGRLKEPMAELYHQTHVCSNPALLHCFKTVLKASPSLSKEQTSSNQQIQNGLIWPEEIRTCQITDLEKEFQQQLGVRESRTYEEEVQPLISALRSRHENELAKSRSTIDAQKQEISQLSRALITAQRNAHQAQTQVDKLKEELTDLRLQWNRETKKLKELSGQHRSRLQAIQTIHSVSEAESEFSVTDDESDGRREVCSPSLGSEMSTVAALTCERLSAVCPSSTNCVAANRKRLSALPDQHADTDLCEADGSEPLYRLVLAGDAGSGKSSFLLRLSRHEFSENVTSTVGADCKTKRMFVDGEETVLQIWDTAGQERFHSISRSYFRKAHGVLLLYDVTAENSFLSLKQWIEQIQVCVGEPVPMCIIGNKADLRLEFPEGHCISTACGERLAMAYKALFCETSAKEGTNVVEAVLHLAREVKKTRGVICGDQLQLRGEEQTAPRRNCCWM